MELGIIGLGRMGGNISQRLMRAGHRTVVYDRNEAVVHGLADKGAQPSTGLADMVAKLTPPRAIWVMLPAGKVTESTVSDLADLLSPGDTIIDGGNTYYKDDIRRARTLRDKGITYVDVGTSGGIWGIERGYCMMIGGQKDAVDRLDPIFKTLAPGIGNIERTPDREGHDPRSEQGYIHAGPAGAGHFVKMVHNGIEYGLMQAYAEGFDILRNKNSTELPEAERLHLVRLAVADNLRLRAEDVEFGLPRPSYTIATLDVLRQRHAGVEFVLLIGADNLPGLSQWKDAARLLAETDIYVYPRPGAVLPTPGALPRVRVLRAARALSVTATTTPPVPAALSRL